MRIELTYGTGMWAWLLQRVTGFLLVIYLFMHIGWAHGIRTPIDFLFTRTETAILILLVLVLPHALNGFRVFAIDLGMDDRAQKILFWILMLIGVLAILWHLGQD